MEKETNATISIYEIVDEVISEYSGLISDDISKDIRNNSIYKGITSIITIIWMADLFIFIYSLIIKNPFIIGCVMAFIISLAFGVTANLITKTKYIENTMTEMIHTFVFRCLVYHHNIMLEETVKMTDASAKDFIKKIGTTIVESFTETLEVSSNIFDN